MAYKDSPQGNIRGVGAAALCEECPPGSPAVLGPSRHSSSDSPLSVFWVSPFLNLFYFFLVSGGLWH